jgi:hypothetical protein
MIHQGLADILAADQQLAQACGGVAEPRRRALE